MKKFTKLLICLTALTFCLCAFAACSGTSVYKCVSYDFVADDGQTTDMTNYLNSLTLTLEKDGKCVVSVATPAGVNSYGGTWTEQDGYIVTNVNADWSMRLKKEGDTLVHTAAEVINGNNGVSTVVFQKQ